MLFLRRLALLAAAGCICTAEHTPPATPTPLPAQVTTKAIAYVEISGKLYSSSNTTLYTSNGHYTKYNDATVAQPSKAPAPPHCDAINITEYFLSTGSYAVNNGICRTFPNEYNSSSVKINFANYFASLPLAQLNGSGILSWYSDKPLPKYSFESPDSNGTYWIDEVRTDGGLEARVVAVDFSQITTPLPGAKPLPPLHQVVHFASWDTGELPKDILTLPTQCTEPGPRCNPSQTAAESAINKTFYLAHPLNETGQLANQDVGDLLGDTNFLCYYSNQPAAFNMDDYNALSEYTLEVDSRWGVYSLCNGYPGECLGNEKFAVGREQSTPCGVLGGQCTDNSAYYGNWFSLPQAGQCKPGETVAGGSCTWRIIERVKTIALDCLVTDQNFTAKCKADDATGGAPFPTASQAFVASLASVIKADGGCPSVA